MTTANRIKGRTPPGVRGLKPRRVDVEDKFGGRTPPGVRGLKRRLNRHYRARKRGASSDKDILLFDLMGLFIIGINKHNFPFFSLLTPIRFKKRSFMSFLNRIGVIKTFTIKFKLSYFDNNADQRRRNFVYVSNKFKFIILLNYEMKLKNGKTKVLNFITTQKLNKNERFEGNRFDRI